MSFESFWIAVFGIGVLAVQYGVAAGQDAPASDANRRALAFIAQYESQIRPLEIAVNRAWWQANTSGKDADFAAKEKAQNELDESLSDSKQFAKLKAIKGGKLSDPIVAREIDGDGAEYATSAGCGVADVQTYTSSW